MTDPWQVFDSWWMHLQHLWTLLTARDLTTRNITGFSGQSGQLSRNTTLNDFRTPCLEATQADVGPSFGPFFSWFFLTCDRFGKVTRDHSSPRNKMGRPCPVKLGLRAPQEFDRNTSTSRENTKNMTNIEEIVDLNVATWEHHERCENLSTSLPWWTSVPWKGNSVP